MARQRPDHAAHGIDIERRGCQSEDVFQNLVEPTHIGAGDQNPRHGGEQTGNGEREQRHAVEPLTSRRIRPLDDPRDKRAHHKCERRSTDCKDHRRGEDFAKMRAGQNIHKILDREIAGPHRRIFGERGVKQGGDWNDHQPTREQRA